MYYVVSRQAQASSLYLAAERGVFVCIRCDVHVAKHFLPFDLAHLISSHGTGYLSFSEEGGGGQEALMRRHRSETRQPCGPLACDLLGGSGTQEGGEKGRRKGKKAPRVPGDQEKERTENNTNTHCARTVPIPTYM